MNKLKDSTSPYLLQHKDNPVDWHPWGGEAFDLASRENKPVLLSVGYAACHWCHVMARESFSDTEIGARMNESFINIKVDREEHPQIDALYQQAAALMGVAGGWPLTLFLTPAGDAFWGGTYFPPLPRHGLPAFAEVLAGVSDAWKQEQDKIAFNVRSLKEALTKMHDTVAGPLPADRRIAETAQSYVAAIDPVHGGFGQQGPKFPCLPVLDFLWQQYVLTGSDQIKDAVLNSLLRMAAGGIYDHIGGGFARYAVDAEWLVPHFEKMLTDNAQFIALMTEVWRETRHPVLAARIGETVEWLLREMRVTQDNLSAFASSLDAESVDAGTGEKKEGAFYLWTAQEIAEVLGPDADAFRAGYDITQGGNWPDGGHGINIPNRLSAPQHDAAEEEKLSAAREKLLRRRGQRPPPSRDDKVLADANGMAIAALVMAARAFDKAAWLAAAMDAFSFIQKFMQQDNRLHRSWAAGSADHDPVPEDYAHMALAALSLFEATGEGGYLQQAQAWAATMTADFGDAERGGFFMTPNDAGYLPLRPKGTDDTAVPSGNAAAADVLLRLFLHTGKDDDKVEAERTLEALAGMEGADSPYLSRASCLQQITRLRQGLSLAITEGRGAKELHDIAAQYSAPQLVVLPKTDKEPIGGRATAYLCDMRRCLPPVFEADELRRLLQSARRGYGQPANDGDATDRQDGD